MSARLALQGIACVRGGRTLFAGVSLALASGEAAVVTGPNGVGKSSLIRIAAGLLAPAQGTVERGGGFALLTEGPALDPELPLIDALVFWARIDGHRDDALTALDRVGLAPMADAPVRWLSTGQRKRAGLARMLCSRAGVWLLDEPANGLDVRGTEVLETLIAAHRASGGVVLVATHVPIDVPDARQVRL